MMHLPHHNHPTGMERELYRYQLFFGHKTQRCVAIRDEDYVMHHNPQQACGYRINGVLTLRSG
jgi:hypothetical protein